MIYLPVEMNRNGTAYSYFSKKAGKAKTNNREVPGKLWCLCDYWWGVSFSAEQSGAVQFFLISSYVIIPQKLALQGAFWHF